MTAGPEQGSGRPQDILANLPPELAAAREKLLAEVAEARVAQARGVAHEPGKPVDEIYDGDLTDGLEAIANDPDQLRIYVDALNRTIRLASEIPKSPDSSQAYLDALSKDI